MKCSPTTGKTNLNRLTSERAKKTKANENQIFVNVTKQLNFAKKKSDIVMYMIRA